MHISFLRKMDRWLGDFLLIAMAPLAVFAARHLTARDKTRPRTVFIKMKGGGSLIIAMPSLLGLRKKNPDSEFVLICTSEAGIFSDITGLFDRHIIVDDRNLFTLALTSLKALKASFRSSCCIDLEPNSILAAVFAMLTCSTQRIGLVATTNHARRGWAYTSAIAFNPHAPIHVYYDKIVEECGAAPTSAADCRKAILSRLPKPDRPKGKAKTIAIVAFTSGYIKERMMPPETWAALLQQNHKNDPLHLLILGSSHNDLAAQKLADAMKNLVPFAHIENCAGRWSLMQTAAHMAICDEVWSVDSGPLHIARLLGIPTRSFWGPTMPSQRLRPIEGLAETVHYRPFLCSPCVPSHSEPPCKGRNVCMISMADPNPNLHPIWVDKT